MDSLVAVEIDQAKLELVRQRTRAIPGALKRIVPRALNSAIIAKRDQGSVWNLALRRIGQALPVKPKALKKRLFGNRATNMRWEASIACGRIPFVLDKEIPVTVSRRLGVSAQLFGRPVRWRHAFRHPQWGRVAMRKPLGSGKVLDWREAEEAEALVPRLPVMKVQGPSVGDVWRELPPIAREAERVGARRVERTLYIETEKEIVKRMPR